MNRTGRSSLRRTEAIAAACLAAVLAAGVARAPEDPVDGPTPPEPADYRMDGYRTPTPATLKGAVVLDTAAAERLWRDGRAVFVDVMPRPEKPANLPAGTIWRDAPRDHLPRSAWLINVGYGALEPRMEAFFRASLRELTGGDAAKPLAFYCRRACWMSWNAAKRAMEWGYSAVYWYPDGSDGWAEAGLPLEAAQPYRTGARE
ncbi:PQQ-dependent catabolism-associated CXXCW motif protein [Methylopila henanensis]|uniref:PQQ-dependent catabolism-associated CXXCW motif protein n=1 Tax=Methylopila henanensis TaxID=873516 RepID=A0ABW4K5C3_9HYPH